MARRLKTKIGLAFPVTSGNVSTRFFISAMGLRYPAPTALLTINSGGTIAQVRNALVQGALREKCTHVAMLDTDQEYPAGTLEQLLKHNLPVVHGKVHRRYHPYDPILLRRASDDRFDYRRIPDEDWLGKGLIEVDATGTGCVMYKVEVFKKIPEPWFEWETTKNGRPVGEDISFCAKLQESGYKIMVDCNLKIDHLRELPINEANYLAYVRDEQERNKEKAA